MQLEEVARRLERLEGQCRRWRRLAIMFALIVAPAILSTLYAVSKTREYDQLDGLLIRDKQGRVRVDLGTWEDGRPRMLFVGANGKIRSDLGLGVDQTPWLSFNDPGGIERITMTLAKGEGEPAIMLSDASQKCRASLVLGARGDPRLALMDPEGNLRLSAAVNEEGLPILDLLDGQGRPRFELHLDKDGKPVMGRPRP